MKWDSIPGYAALLVALILTISADEDLTLYEKLCGEKMPVVEEKLLMCLNPLENSSYSEIFLTCSLWTYTSSNYIRKYCDDDTNDWNQFEECEKNEIDSTYNAEDIWDMKKIVTKCVRDISTNHTNGGENGNDSAEADESLRRNQEESTNTDQDLLLVTQQDEKFTFFNDSETEDPINQDDEMFMNQSRSSFKEEDETMSVNKDEILIMDQDGIFNINYNDSFNEETDEIASAPSSDEVTQSDYDELMPAQDEPPLTNTSMVSNSEEDMSSQTEFNEDWSRNQGDLSIEGIKNISYSDENIYEIGEEDITNASGDISVSNEDVASAENVTGTEITDEDVSQIPDQDESSNADADFESGQDEQGVTFAVDEDEMRPTDEAETQDPNEEEKSLEDSESSSSSSSSEERCNTRGRKSGRRRNCRRCHRRNRNRSHKNRNTGDEEENEGSSQENRRNKSRRKKKRDENRRNQNRRRRIKEPNDDQKEKGNRKKKSKRKPSELNSSESKGN